MKLSKLKSTAVRTNEDHAVVYCPGMTLFLPLNETSFPTNSDINIKAWEKTKGVLGWEVSPCPETDKPKNLPAELHDVSRLFALPLVELLECASMDFLRGALQHLMVTPHYVACTDGHRLYKIDGMYYRDDLIIPRYVVDAVKYIDMGAPCSIRVCSDFIQLWYDNGTVIEWKDEGYQIPAIERVIPTNNKRWCRIENVEELRAALKRIGPLTNVKTHLAQINGKRIATKTAYIQLSFCLSPFPVGINVKYLLSLLDGVQDGAWIKYGDMVKGSYIQPILIQEHTSDTIRLLMPLHVWDEEAEPTVYSPEKRIYPETQKPKKETPAAKIAKLKKLCSGRVHIDTETILSIIGAPQ